MKRFFSSLIVIAGLSSLLFISGCGKKSFDKSPKAIECIDCRHINLLK